MKKTKVKESAPGVELRRRAMQYQADAERMKRSDPKLAAQQQWRAEGLVDAAEYIDVYLAQHRDETPAAGDDVGELAQSIGREDRLAKLEQRVAALEGARGGPLPGPMTPKHPPVLDGLLAESPRASPRPKIIGPSHTNGAGADVVDADDADVDEDVDASAYDLALLHAFGSAPVRITAAQGALLAGVSPISGSMVKSMRRLRRAGLLEQDAEGRYETTPKGEARLATSPRPSATAEGLVPYWSMKLGEYSGTLLAILAGASPAEVSQEELSKKSGFSRKSGSFAKALRRLRRLHMVDGMRLSPELAQLLEWR